jgi:acyl carrier protein
MKDEAILERVTGILVEEFEIEKDDISLESKIYEDLELDSLDGIDLIVALENDFQVKIDREKDETTIREMRTVQDIIDFIKSKSGS